MPIRLHPKELDALLLTSDAALLRLLAAHAVEAPRDVSAFRERIRSEPADLHPELANTLRTIAEMADDHGREMLTSSLGPMFASEESNAYIVASEGWLDHRALFQRLHSRRRHGWRGQFQEFNGREPHRLSRPPPEKLAALERWLGTAFEKRGATRHCEIVVCEHDDCIAFEIAHGRPLQARPVIEVEDGGATREEVLEFRPRELDVVIYDNRTHRIRVSARTAFTIRAYLQAVSEVLFGDIGWFAAEDIICLKPLLAGRQCLARTPGVDRVELVVLEVKLRDVHNGSCRFKADDVFGSLEARRWEIDENPLAYAELRFFFTGGGRGRRVRLRPPNRLDYDRSRDERVVRNFLEQRGFLAPSVVDLRKAG